MAKNKNSISLIILVAIVLYSGFSIYKKVFKDNSSITESEKIMRKVVELNSEYKLSYEDSSYVVDKKRYLNYISSNHPKINSIIFDYRVAKTSLVSSIILTDSIGVIYSSGFDNPIRHSISYGTSDELKEVVDFFARNVDCFDKYNSKFENPKHGLMTIYINTENGILIKKDYDILNPKNEFEKELRKYHQNAFYSIKGK